MEYITYREELDSMKLVNNGELILSNYIPTMLKLIKIIKLMTNRTTGYIAFMSKNKNPLIAIQVIEVLKNILEDNELIIDEEYNTMCKNLIKYLSLILENLDEIIRSNPNIIYDEDSDENDAEISINCDMINESFSLMNEIINTYTVNSTTDINIATNVNTSVEKLN